MLLDIDKRWIVSYNPLFSCAFEAHINVEFTKSMKSIGMSANDAGHKATGGSLHELGAKQLILNKI